MLMTPDLIYRLLEALALGLGVALLLRLFGRFALVRRLQVSLILGAMMVGAYWLVSGLGLPGTILKVLIAVGIMIAANAALQLFDYLLWDYVLGKRRHIPIPRLLIDLFNFVVLTAVGVAVLNRLFAVELSAFLVTSTVISAVIGLALQDMLASVVAGLALQLERPFQVGDWVHVSGQEGQVMQMNWRTLTLKTLDNHNIILPNASVAKQDITNYSRPTPLQRMHVRVGVAYRHPPGQVKTVLARAAAQAEGVMADPPPEVVVDDYGDFSVQYDVRYWIADYAHWQQIHDAVMTRLWYELKRADLTIPFPVRDVTLHTLPADHETLAQEKLRREIFAELRPLPLFAPLNDSQIEQLVRNASTARYTAGEILVQQGEAGDSLFVIKSGRVRVELRREGAAALTVDTLGPDEFFGEMSLLTGEPRSASIVAETETEVIVVEKSDLAEVIRADMSLLDGLSLALEARVRHSADQVAAADSAPARPPMPPAALLTRIRGFFGIPWPT
jgi:small-conductance mechanosensitive channel